jgi:hypothetical protein
MGLWRFMGNVLDRNGLIPRCISIVLPGQTRRLMRRGINDLCVRVGAVDRKRAQSTKRSASAQAYLGGQYRIITPATTAAIARNTTAATTRLTVR